jgi:hypothetical protein
MTLKKEFSGTENNVFTALNFQTSLFTLQPFLSLGQSFLKLEYMWYTSKYGKHGNDKN